jgi:hypothetical protein
VSGFGGYKKEYQVRKKPDRMRALNVTSQWRSRRRNHMMVKGELPKSIFYPLSQF